MNGYELKRIKVLDAKINENENAKVNRLNSKTNVCAYCRVSTDSQDQQSSYDSQISYYRNKITNNYEWQLVDIYADEGISGTSTKNRIGFNKMIKDCEAGKIDIVLTKSISRFSRNIVDCLTYVRKLKDLGIKIIFEKENIDTLSQNGELMLTLLSSLAEEESRSISNNVRWSLEKKFERGEALIPGSMLGYRISENKNLEIVEEEAEIVRMIFRLFLEGESYRSICSILENLGYKTGQGNTKWHYSAIARILKNEKYMGDAHLQKTYTRDFMDKKRKENKGEKKAYYVENSHPAIISKEDFEKVEQEIRRRTIYKNKNNKVPNTKYVLSDILACAECGSPYRRVTWKAQYVEPRYVWRCDNRLKNGKKYCKKSPTLDESVLHRAIMDCIAGITENDNIEKNLLKNKKTVKEKSVEVHTDKHTRIFENELEKYEQEKIEKLDINSTIRLDRGFDEALVRQLIHKIKVISKEEIAIEFISAIKIIKKLDS